MNVAAIVDDTIARFRLLVHAPAKKNLPATDSSGRPATCRGRREYRARNPAGIARTPAPASSHQFLPVLQRRAQMRRAGREIAVMQVIGLDPAFDEGPHQRFQRRVIVIDAAQQHRLADHGNAGVDHGGACGARLVGQFPGMIGVQCNPGRRALDLQCCDHLAR